MKKTLLFAAVVATTLASCSKNEITDDVPGISTDTKSINFVTTTGITRANNNGIDDLKNSTGLLMFGMKKANSAAPELLFADGGGSGTSNKYQWSSATSTWGWQYPDAGDKKWPTADDDYTLQFFSIFPDQGDHGRPLLANYGKDFGVQDWKLTTEHILIDERVQAQEDYLMAITEEIKTVPTNGMAKLDFKHILSNILFSIVTPEGYKILINDLKIKNVAGVKTDAKFTVFDADAANRCTWADASTSVDGTKSYSYFASDYTTNTEVTGAAGNAAVPLYSNPTDADTKKISPKLMPQANTTSWKQDEFNTLFGEWASNGGGTYQEAVLNKMTGAHIELTYAMVDAEGVCVVGQVAGKKNPADKSDYAATKFVTVAFPLYFDKDDYVALATPWKMGTKYTYNLRLGMPDSSNGVLIDPEYKDETGTVIPGESVDNPSTANPGDVVTDTDRRIDFTVGVSGWDGEADPGHDIK